ncbi:MAG: DUF2784 domain-containing protein [Betaproteobacteria bacterium HGW-Betaproteobacteria-7]|jgi:hypothetical protein|nr:MAG: DUF2784 domain-containing protein [Betaproteobacteria bacterium HGW-Betaproteobacteria-7]
MSWRLLADAVLAIHFAFILLVVFGGLLAVWRWRLAWLHLPALAWGIWIQFTGRICPLTPLENRLRLLGGEAGYSGSFIEHYLLSLIYPDGLTRSLQLGLGLGLIVFNALVYAWAWWRRRRHAR